jgi:predicted dehydrogenase
MGKLFGAEIMKDQIRFGIIGCGQVSRVGHGPAISADSRAMLVAVVDPDADNRASFARRFKVSHAYKNHKEMFAKERLDAVIIATPPWLHREIFEDCISASVHILCEKPLATTHADSRRMIELAEGHDKIVQICHSKRFETGFQRIKEWCDQSTLGRIYQISIAWHYYIPDFSRGFLRKGLDLFKKAGIDFEKKYGAWRYFDLRAGGGDFFDHGPHYIDLMRFFFGEIESIYCKTGFSYPGRKFEDQAIATFTLSNGALAVMEKSNLAMGRPDGFERGTIHAEKAKVRFEAFQEYQHRPMKLGIYKVPNIIPDIYTPVCLPRGIHNTLYFRQMTHFIDRMTGADSLTRNFGGKWAADIRDAAIAVAWTLAAYQSSKEGREIRRKELFIDMHTASQSKGSPASP